MRWLIFAILLSTAVFASDIVAKGDVALLALVDNGTAQAGSVSQLELELRHGSERVFLETFPMTKITTQASLRFAQQVACSELEIDCSRYDFLFTIRALPGIVGGPSAGSAAATLTAALLLNKTVPPTVAMTGTINSGGIIGTVGGVRQKIEAASSKKYDRVYIPKGSKDIEYANKTISLIDFAKNLNVELIEVATFGQILEAEFGIEQESYNASLIINEKYKDTMKSVSSDLCSRARDLGENVNISRLKNFTSRAKLAQENEEYYAAASYCFRANVEYRKKEYSQSNKSIEIFLIKVNKLEEEAKEFEATVRLKNTSTLTDVQTYMAVMERVTETTDILKSIKKAAKNNKTSWTELGFATERLFSARTWARFFDGDSSPLTINEASLKRGCASKISEAQERYNYVKSILPDALDGTKKDIENAHKLLRSKDYKMCLYTASKAKAEADVLMGLFGVEELRFDDLIQIKLQIARQALTKAQNKGIFPIIAYSYYEYANSLRDFDKVSSLLFAEYSLELANLEIYFSDKKVVSTDSKAPVVNNRKLAGILLAALGILIVVSGIMQSKSSKRKIKRKSKKSRLKSNSDKTLQASRGRLRGKKR